MSVATARVRTELPRRYMTRLCGHFEHRYMRTEAMAELAPPLMDATASGIPTKAA